MSKTLIDYQKQEKHKPADAQTVPSGVKSPNSEREMRVIIPLVQHPEIKGLYKAIDPGTKTEKPWTGWVEYTPPTIEPDEKPKPTALQLKQELYAKNLNLLKKRFELIDLGVITKEEANLPTLQAETKSLAVELGEIE